MQPNYPARTRAFEVQADPATQPFLEKEMTEKQLKINEGAQIACIGSVRVKKLEFCSAMLSLLAFAGSIFLIYWAQLKTNQITTRRFRCGGATSQLSTWKTASRRKQ